MAKRIQHAFFAALLAGVIIAPIFGFQILRVGMQTTLQPDWPMIFWGMGLVFVFQLIRPSLLSLLAKRQQSFSLPRLNDKTRQVALFFIIIGALIWPFFSGRAEIDIATLVLIYVMLGLGLNIVVGFAGLLDLGFVGFYAVGAYTYALLYYWAGWGFWASLPAAGAMAALFGYLLGFPVLRLRGDYLAIVTLGFGEIIRLLLINLYPITGGPDGISGIPKPTVFGYVLARRAPEGQMTFHELMGWKFNNVDVIIYLYLLALILALITLFVSNRLIRMPIGRAWEALREDEIACRSLGINHVNVKLSAFMMGAVAGGVAGVFFATYQGFINPTSFNFFESVLILSIVVLGGMGSMLGVIIAALVLTLLPELLRDFANYRVLVFGLLMILMMIWRPHGLIRGRRPAFKGASQ